MISDTWSCFMFAIREPMVMNRHWSGRKLGEDEFRLFFGSLASKAYWAFIMEKMS